MNRSAGWALAAGCWRRWRSRRTPCIVTDDRGVARASCRSRRSASSRLLPSLTESVCALGACERLVGVDRYSNWPDCRARAAAARRAASMPNVEAHRRAQARRGAAGHVVARHRAARGAGPQGGRARAEEPCRRAARARHARPGAGRAATRSACGAPSTPAWPRRRSRCRPALRGHARVLRGQQRALCGGRGLVHRRDAGAARRAATSCRPRSGPFPSSTPSSWCAPIPTADHGRRAQRAGAGAAAGLGRASARCATAASAASRAAESDVLVRPGPRMGEAAQLMAALPARTSASEAASATAAPLALGTGAAAAARRAAACSARASAAPASRACCAARRDPVGAADRVGHPPAAHAGRLAGRRAARAWRARWRRGCSAIRWPIPTCWAAPRARSLGVALAAGRCSACRRPATQLGGAPRPDRRGLRRRGAGGAAHAGAGARRAADAAAAAGRRDRRRGARRRQGPDHHRCRPTSCRPCRASCSAAPAWSAGAPAA